MIHTGDITHLSKPKEFDDADQLIGARSASTYTMCRENTTSSTRTTARHISTRYGKKSKGKGWYSFDHGGVHFIGLVNVYDLKAGGMGNLGAEQLAWLAADVKGKSASTPIVVFAHIPLWTIAAGMGLGHARQHGCAETARALWLGDRAQWPYSPDHAEGRRQCDLPHRAFHRFSAAGARHSALARAKTRSGRRIAERSGRLQRKGFARQAAARHRRFFVSPIGRRSK